MQNFDLELKGKGHSDLILVLSLCIVLMHACTKYHACRPFDM